MEWFLIINIKGKEHNIKVNIKGKEWVPNTNQEIIKKLEEWIKYHCVNRTLYLIMLLNRLFNCY